MEEVLPAVQQAAGPQGIEVARDDGGDRRAGARAAGRFVDFLRDVRNEIRKVTWPTWDELKKATLVIVAFVAVLGFVIGVMDTALQFLLVTSVARLFR